MRVNGSVLILLGFVSANGHRDAPTPPDPRRRASVDTVEVPCNGTRVERGNALRMRVESTSTGTVRLGKCEYDVAALPRNGYNTGILIGNKDGLTILGSGRESTIVKFQRPVYIGFEIQSHTTNLTIADMTIAGSITESLCTENADLNSPELLCYGPRDSSRPNTTGIGTREHEGQERINGVLLANLEVRDLANGIRIGPGGDCDQKYVNTTVRDNYVHDIHGTYTGSGYAIVNACAQNATIRNNTILRAGRHAIYQPGTIRSNPYPIVIVGNTIIDHGHGGELYREHTTALAVARSDNVAVIDNTLVGGHGRALSVEEDIEKDCTRCLLIGNKFLNDGSYPDIWISAKSPVWMWHNTRDHNLPATVDDPDRRQTNVADKGDFWAGTQAIAAMYDSVSGKDYLYVMQNNVLHRVRPDYGTSPETGWREYVYSTTTWSAFFGITADHGSVYLWERDRLHSITPQSTIGAWDHTSSTGWVRPGGMASSADGYLYIIQNATLHHVRPSDWSYILSTTQLDNGPHGIAAGLPGVVYVRSDRRRAPVFTITTGIDRTAWPRTTLER